MLGGPYCEKHKQSKCLPRLSTAATSPSSLSQQQSNNRQPSQPSSSHTNGRPTNMVPQEEKTRDAITVKTPFTMYGPTRERPTSEKKQLPDKRTARKTTGSTSSRQIPTPTSATRDPDSRPSLNRSSTGESSSLDKRPVKRQRLASDTDHEGRGARHNAPPLTKSSTYSYPKIKKPDSEDSDLEITTASDFALHPRKAHPTSSEAMNGCKKRENQGTRAKPLHKAPPARKVPFSPHNVIDLTGDDPEPKPSRKTLHSSVRKVHDKSLNGLHPRVSDTSHKSTPSVPMKDPHQVERKACDRERLPKETQRMEAITGRGTGVKRSREVEEATSANESSIEVQTASNKGVHKSTEHVNTPPVNIPSVQKSQNHTRNSHSDPPANLLPKKPVTKIAPRPVPTLVPSSPRPPLSDSQSKQVVNGSWKVSQPIYPPDKESTDLPDKNGKRVQQVDHKQDLAAVEKDTDGVAVDDHPSVSNGPSTVGDNALSTNEKISEPRLIAKPTPQFHPEQVKAFIREIVERPRTASPLTSNGTSREKSRAANLDASLPQPDSGTKASPAFLPPNSEKTVVSNIQTVPEPRAIDPSTSTQHKAQPVGHEPQHTGEQNSIDAPARFPITKSTLASTVKGRSWKRLNPEERRQAWVAHHEPAKFDSYIYGKLNEANRPDSPLFGLPGYEQPLRQTRPATHFAHIDPRIHWTRPHSQKWYREKQCEIRRRGTRKSNFGKAAARRAKQRREDEEDCVGPDLPDRVKHNPTWVAALDELDDMAATFYSQRREKLLRNSKHMNGLEREPDSVDEMDEDSS